MIVMTFADFSGNKQVTKLLELILIPNIEMIVTVLSLDLYLDILNIFVT